MFKLESYITPLLLSYVDKYIKNLKPEDSQFSLWGGDALFSNLDLRLDVLEQELQLPFTFVNGHIHELRIHVPWTKLGSEPVVITINTIECILKLSTDSTDSDSRPKKHLSTRGLKKPDIGEAPPGYVQSLINRVVSNICIICNNVVLKYVEDDIVLSLNIKSVELFNANEKWEKAFVDTNMADTISRKVIYMQDLTVCLDKRDASGKIETYQDPLLYRCSSTWRMYSVYKAPHSKHPSLTRIHMYCESLDFSLTDQQLPMFLRLLNLVIALHNGSNLTSQENMKVHEDVSELKLVLPEDELDEAEDTPQDDSWGSWAWSFVPDVGGLWSSSNTEEDQEEANILKSKKIFQFGIYIGKSSCVLKHTVVSQDSSFCSTPKCIFSPLMVIKMYGCSMEFTSKGKDFINVQSGICGVTVTGLEDCACGFQDFSLSSNEKRSIFLKSGVPPGSGHAYSFLSSSLFDPLAPENCNQERKYCFIFQEHLSTLTEEVMVKRFPAFAFDYLYELEVPEDWIDKISTITSSFLEDSNWHESSTCRLVFGPFCVDITSSLVHRVQKLIDSAKDYDYPYYSQARKSSADVANIDEDVLAQMEEFVPLRQYHLTLFKPVLRLSVADHSPYHGSKTEAKKVKKRNIKSSKNAKNIKPFETLFNLEIYADCLDLQATTPMYPNKLVKVVGSISYSNQFLLHHCYNTKSAKVFGLEITLHKESLNKLPDCAIIIDCMYQSWIAKNFNPSGLEKLKVALEESANYSPNMSAEISDVNILHQLKKDIEMTKFSVSSVWLKFQNDGIDGKKIELQEEHKQVFLQLLLQVPKDMNNENPALLFLHVSGSTTYLELAFFNWLSSALFTHIILDVVELDHSCSSPADFEDASTCSSFTQEASTSYSLSKSQSTILISSKKVSLQENVENFLLKHCHFLSYLVLEVDIGNLCGIVPQSTWSVKYEEGLSVLYSWQQAEISGCLNGACVFCMPAVKINNNSSVSSLLQKIDFAEISMPIKTLQCDKRSEDCFRWTLQIDQAELLVHCFDTVSNVVKFVERVESWINYFKFKTPDVSEHGVTNLEIKPSETNFNYKKAGDASHCKKTSASEVKSQNMDESKPPQRMTIWIQLALSKLCVTVFGKLSPESSSNNFKLQFDAEEIVSSVDIQEIYSKMKFKLSSLNVTCFVKPSGTDSWIHGPYDGKVVFCSNMVSKNIKSKTITNGNNLGQHSHVKPDNQPFLVANYTQALHSNVKEKLSSSDKQTKIAVEEMKYISEIDLKVKSFGVILWMSLVDILNQISIPFGKVFTSDTKTYHSFPSREDTFAMKFCGRNLPLFYVETNIIQMYLPENCTLTKSVLKENYRIDQSVTDVLLLQLDCVTLTSQVENPLPRIILESEIYIAAVNSKTIALPGASVEDRQYQMDIYGLTLGTISGASIVCQNDPKKEFISHYPLTMGENPALEWNIGVIPENRNFSDDSAMVTPIISPLNLRFAFAPSIVCDSSESTEKIPVAGVSSEISISSEVFLYLSIHQACFLYSLLRDNLDFVHAVFDNASKQSDVHIDGSSSPISYSKNSRSSSVFSPRVFTPDSANLQGRPRNLVRLSKLNFVPYEFLVTAGTVSVMLFYYDSDFKNKSQHFQDYTAMNYMFSNAEIGRSSSICSTLDDSRNVIPSSIQDASSLITLHPFLCLTITQPHSYLSCHPTNQKFESSCFDLQLHGSSADFVVKKPYKSSMPIHDDFNHSYLETKPGEPHQKTGIPPAFLTITCTDIFTDAAKVRISVERPMKLNFRTSMGEAFLTFLKRFQEEFREVSTCKEEQLLSESITSSEENLTVKNKLLTFFVHMTFYTSQIVLEFTPLLDASCEKLVISAGSLRIGIDLETCENGVKGFDLNLNLFRFVVQTSSNDQIWSFLQPLSFLTMLKCHLKPCLQIELFVSGESLLLNASLHHGMKLRKLVEAILEHLQKNLENLKNIFNSEQELSTVSSSCVEKDNKKRTYWNDDLRKGAFQFIQIGESNEYQPKPHEIVFNRSSANEPASMTWCYPEPRALTKIEVSPVPFKSGEEERSKKVITCYLQYWNSTHQEYVNIFDFVLSETEHFSLDLPDLNSDSVAVSNKWRVLLDCESYIDDDGILEKENPYLSPLALAACMSIDSCFDPVLVPVFQATVSFEVAKIIFYNYFGKSGCSPKFFHFEFDDEAPLIQEFSVLSFINPSCSYIKWISKVKAEISSGVKCEVLEYRNLTMLPVISPVDILANVAIHHDKENVPIFDMELILNPCFIRLSQSIIHTFNYTLHSISQEMSVSPLKGVCSEFVLPNYYIICNNLEERIRFGQAGTDENIILSPLKMHAYSWWCHKRKQILWISVGSLCWKWSKGFSIDSEGTTSVKIDNNVAVIVKIKKLSNFQKQVIIDGQLKIHSELNYPIQLRCEFPASALQESKTSNLVFVKSLSPQCSSPTFLLSSEQYQNMRLSITGILDSQLWSENIHIGDNMLLQIPWEANGRYQTVWCQVIQQKNASGNISIVVFVSPLFILRSNLPFPINVTIASVDQKETYSTELTGQGQETNILKFSDPKSELHLTFQTCTDLKMFIPPMLISVSDINQISLNAFDDTNSLFDSCCKMQQLHHRLWPYSYQERPSYLQDEYMNVFYPCSDRDCAISPAVPSNNVSCKLKIERSQRWSGLNTVLYDIKPDVILMNRLRTDLFLFDKNEMEWMLPPNSVAMPSRPFERFRLGVLENGEFFYSSFLTVERSQNVYASNSDSFLFCGNSDQRIPQNGSVNVFIKIQVDKQKVFLFKLHSEVQENIVIITVFPIVILASDVDVELHFSLFCASNKVEDISLPQSNPAAVSKIISKDCHPLLVWEVDSEIYSSEAISLDYYISVSVSFPIWSSPVYFGALLQENNRHTISVPVESTDKTTNTIPLVITSHLRNGMLFLIINIDPCPLLLLHNRTNMNIYYGQSFFNTDGKFGDKSVYEELEKHGLIPVLKPGSSAHYSYPSMQRLFPKVPDKFSMLCFGLMDETSQKYVWSIPFKVNIEKQFVHILGVCDFMVCSERVGHTVNLFIDPVNRIEVNANEVRSRIALATNAGVSSDKKESVKSKENISKKGSEIKQKSKIQSSSSKQTRKPSNITAVPSNVYFVNMRVIHVSLILCDEFQEVNKSIEVLRLNIDNVVLHSRPQNDYLSSLQDISLCFEHIQLDNQLSKEGKVVYDFPVVLLRRVSDKNPAESSDHQNIFLPNKIRENSMFILNTVIELCGEERKSIVVQSVKIDFSPMSIQIEDTFYYKVKNLLKTYIPEEFHQHESPWRDISVPKDTRGISITLMHPVHLEHFRFNVTEVSVSLHANVRLYLSIERSVLNFQPFEREELFTSHYEIGELMQSHYTTGAMFRAGWIVGSVDLLGNPAGFARAVRSGVSDFVYLPYQGLLHGPRSFISGLTNGAISLVTSISSGAINSMANFTSSVSKNMDFICLDEEHLARQELVRRQLPDGVTEGLAQGLSAFGLSVLGAVAGIVDHPLQVLVSPTTPLRTATSFVGGIGKGLVGVIAKPIGGACELLSQTGYGLLYGSGWINPAKRRYQPVTMSFDMLSSSIVKYVCKVALCQSFGDVLLSIEATYVNENGEYDKNILLLTSEALCILAEDEVSLQRTFALTEIRCNKSDSDQSTLVVVPTSAFRKQLYSESGDVLDRVAEYIKKNREEISSSTESSSSGLESVSESCRSSPTSHVFFLYPKDRTLFLTLFNFAKSKALHKGF
ncbi:Vacuolar protein sorting-associated protein 13B like protein [Argiope bruennichi]|uniref:Vacuolar protein sorting-associated protein 13B like protein n=1 Tax=Argiope bruennichi TaxID=94029 RepID=A0A8T0FFE8_ARGBR|nr:Vacuolar protein sorting-associated protein 13B like protein [Argiope bruennichi]